MKILIFFLLLSNLSWGQVTYTSPLTQHWPTLFTTEFEEVERSIWFYPDEVVIVTGTKQGKEIQTLLVEDVEYSDQGMRLDCISKDSTAITVVVPYQKRVEIIDIYKPSPKTGEIVQVRLHVD